MQQYSLKLTCLDHSRPILLFLLRPYTLNPNTENVKSLQFCCDDCLMKIPSSDRTGLHCLPLKDINIFFRSLINHPNSMILPQFDHTTNMIEENNLYTYLIELFKRNFLVSPKDPLPCSEDSLTLGLQNLVKPFQQKLILGNVEKLTAGEADFSFESCTYVPDKEYIFVGNRSGELFVIKKGSKEIVKKITCTGRIGAVKYIPEKKTVVVSGLHKYIMKIDVDTLEIMTPSQPSQTTDYKNFIVIEYLKHQELLLVGGFNVEHSIELYNFNDLSLVKTLTYQYAARRLPDELWISLSIDSLDTILLGYKSGNLQVWKSKEFQLVHSFHTFDHIYALEYQSNQKLVYTGHLNGVIQIWQMKRGRFYRTKYTNIGDSPINKMRFLPTACPKYLLISNFTHKLSIWTHLGQKIDEIEIFKEPSRAILVLDDNTIVSAGATAGIIYFIEPKLTETKRKEVEKNKQRPVRMALKDNNWTGNALQQTSLG